MERFNNQKEFRHNPHSIIPRAYQYGEWLLYTKREQLLRDQNKR